MNQSRLNCSHNISWLENLSRGASALLLHPFLPLKRFGFNYECLFSNQQHCVGKVCSVSEHFGIKQSSNQTQFHYFDLARNNLESILNQVKSKLPNQKPDLSSNSLDNLKSRISTFYANPLNYVQAIKPRHSLLISQLILCSFLLGWFLVRDIREIFRYIKYALLK